MYSECSDCGVCSTDFIDDPDIAFEQCHYCNETYCTYCIAEYDGLKPICFACEYSFDGLSS